MAGITLYSADGRRTWAWAALPLAWLFIYAAARASGLLAGLVGLQSSGASGRWQDNIAALFAWGLVLLILWAWLTYREGRSLRSIGLPARWQAFRGGFMLGLAMVVAAVAALVGLGVYDIGGPGAWYNHLTPTWLFATSLVLAGTVLQASVMEALFRGWLMQSVAAQWGRSLAVVSNVALFAWIQASDVVRAPEAMLGAVNLALMAWLLCRVALRDGQLWGACGLNAAWRLVTGLGFGLNIDGYHLNVTPMLLAVDGNPEAPWWLTGGDFGPDGSLAMTLVVGVILLVTRTKGTAKDRRRRESHDDDDIID